VPRHRPDHRTTTGMIITITTIITITPIITIAPIICLIITITSLVLRHRLLQPRPPAGRAALASPGVHHSHVSDMTLACRYDIVQCNTI